MPYRIAVGLACSLLVAAGCGGSKDAPKATPVASAEATAETPETPTPAPTQQYTNGCLVVPATEPRAEGTLSAPTETLDPEKSYVADVKTNCGDFQITLDAKRAPKTGGSFKFLADQGFYDKLTFHRIIPGFVFQGGDPKGDGSGGPGYKVVEAPPKKLVYKKGVVAMAKGQEEPAGTSGSQFFVVTGKDAATLPPDYALLGKISGGQDVVDRIGAIQTDPRTDRPDSPILIESIKVTEKKLEF